jgi:hypothetical protein
VKPGLTFAGFLWELIRILAAGCVLGTMLALLAFPLDLPRDFGRIVHAFTAAATLG